MSNLDKSQQSSDIAGGDFASPIVTEENAPNENKTKEKPKAVQKKRRRASTRKKPYPLQGLHVCLEYEGIKTLATVSSYSYRKKLFKVEFMLVGKPTMYVTREEIMNNKATLEQVMAHNAGSIKVPKKEKKSASRKRTTPESEKESSSQPQIMKFRTCRMNAWHVN